MGERTRSEGAGGLVANSTFDANSSINVAGHGSALTINSTGVLTVHHVTATNNSGPNGAVERQSGTLTLQNSIVANLGAGSGTNCAGTISDGGYNLESPTGSSAACPSGGTWRTRIRSSGRWR